MSVKCQRRGSAIKHYLYALIGKNKNKLPAKKFGKGTSKGQKNGASKGNKLPKSKGIKPIIVLFFMSYDNRLHYIVRTSVDL